jgi:DNA-binding MarR family transcriptional regulator
MAGVRKQVAAPEAPTPTAAGPNELSDYRPRDFGKIAWLIKLAEREVGRELDRELRHTGLTKAQFGVLQALVHLKRASSAALARTVFVTPQAMVGIVGGLETKGYIRRKTSQASARVIEATVTPAGQTAYNKGVEMVVHVDDVLLKEFSDKELKQLNDYLERMIAALQKPQAGFR